MRVLGKRRCFVSDLIMPSDHDALMAEPWPHDGIVFYKPVVRRRDGLLCAGKYFVVDTIKQCAKDERTPEFDCRMIECSDDEARLIQQCDVCLPEVTVMPGKMGARTRHNSLAIMDLLEAKLQLQPARQANGKPGRPTSVRGMLANLFATQQGIARTSITQADSRRRKAGEEYADPPMPPMLDALGMDLDDAFIGETEYIQTILHTASQAITTALRKVRALKERDFPMPTMNVLLEHGKAFARVVRGALPDCLCPFCKGLDGYQENCGACLGVGYISQEQRKTMNIPARLLDPRDPWIMAGGTERRVADLLGVEPEEAPKPAAGDDWFQ